MQFENTALGKPDLPLNQNKQTSSSSSRFDPWLSSAQAHTHTNGLLLPLVLRFCCLPPAAWHRLCSSLREIYRLPPTITLTASREWGQGRLAEQQENRQRFESRLKVGRHAPFWYAKATSGIRKDVRSPSGLSDSQREKSPPLLKLFCSLEGAIDLQFGAFHIQSLLLLLQSSHRHVFKLVRRKRCVGGSTCVTYHNGIYRHANAKEASITAKKILE